MICVPPSQQYGITLLLQGASANTHQHRAKASITPYLLADAHTKPSVKRISQGSALTRRETSGTATPNLLWLATLFPPPGTWSRKPSTVNRQKERTVLNRRRVSSTFDVAGNISTRKEGLIGNQFECSGQKRPPSPPAAERPIEKKGNRCFFHSSEARDLSR